MLETLTVWLRAISSQAIRDGRFRAQWRLAIVLITTLSVRDPIRIVICAAPWGNPSNIRRCIKKSRALTKLGYEMHGMGNKVVYGCDEYNTYTIWKNKQQLQNAVKMYIDMGVTGITYNNEPNYPVPWIREVIDSMGMKGKTVLILDGHDWDEIRRKENIIPIDEREAINVADGIMFPSVSIQDKVTKLNQITKPNTCLYSYCNKNIVDFDIDKINERKNAIVYEGGINSPNDDNLNKIFPYRNLFPIFKQLVTQGNELHAIVGNMDAFLNGQNTGVVMYQPQEYDKMMQMLTQFKWGLLVFNNKDNTEPQVKYTLTNKAMEYIQAGLPILAAWCEESEKWVKKNKVGLTFKDIEEIGDCSSFEDKYTELMDNVLRKRKELVMEKWIWKLELLYARLLGIKGKHIPDKMKQLHNIEYDKTPYIKDTY